MSLLFKETCVMCWKASLRGIVAISCKGCGTVSAHSACLEKAAFEKAEARVDGRDMPRQWNIVCEVVSEIMTRCKVCGGEETFVCGKQRVSESIIKGLAKRFFGVVFAGNTRNRLLIDIFCDVFTIATDAPRGPALMRRFIRNCKTLWDREVDRVIVPNKRMARGILEEWKNDTPIDMLLMILTMKGAIVLEPEAEPLQKKRKVMNSGVSGGRVEAPKDCSVCLDAQANTCIYPCGHLCMCIGCCQRLIDEKTTPRCPLCREEIKCATRVVC